ncbi:hypothetical protein PUN28_013217 [Cardiocondyla obscurior]|uniref:Secreted protein n=1 Tax=Cardiocondyla obscurior TaxID=286306 RepID=A0AAW2F9Z6_9HYME
MKFIAITNYFVYKRSLCSSLPFICLVYTTFVYENKNLKSRGTFPIYFESLPSSDCRRFHRMQSSHRACSTFANVDWGGENRGVFFFELLYLHRDKKRIENRSRGMGS